MTEIKILVAAAVRANAEIVSIYAAPFPYEAEEVKKTELGPFDRSIRIMAPFPFFSLLHTCNSFYRGGAVEHPGPGPSVHYGDRAMDESYGHAGFVRSLVTGDAIDLGLRMDPRWKL
jgi:hypothetical protein